MNFPPKKDLKNVILIQISLIKEFGLYASNLIENLNFWFSKSNPLNFIITIKIICFTLIVTILI